MCQGVCSLIVWLVVVLRRREILLCHGDSGWHSLKIIIISYYWLRWKTFYYKCQALVCTQCNGLFTDIRLRLFLLVIFSETRITCTYVRLYMWGLVVRCNVLLALATFITSEKWNFSYKPFLCEYIHVIYMHIRTG